MLKVRGSFLTARLWVKSQPQSCTQVKINTIFEHKIVNVFLPICFNICIGCSIEPSDWDGSFENPQHMFWLRNKKFFFRYAFLPKVLSDPDLKIHRWVSAG